MALLSILNSWNRHKVVAPTELQIIANIGVSRTTSMHLLLGLGCLAPYAIAKARWVGILKTIRHVELRGQKQLTQHYLSIKIWLAKVGIFTNSYYQHHGPVCCECTITCVHLKRLAVRFVWFLQVIEFFQIMPSKKCIIHGTPKFS